MTIERIYIGPTPGEPQIECAQVEGVAGAGLKGDRYFGLSTYPGQNVTFVEAEVIENFIQQFNRPYDLSITRRNLVTRGVRLNELVGKAFQIGTVRLLGIKLCEPCLELGKALSSP